MVNGALVWGIALLFGVLIGLSVSSGFGPLAGWVAGIAAVWLVIKANVREET